MNRNSGPDCPGGWLEMAPWQGIRFVYEPAVMARRKCTVSRIRLDPGDIPIEEAIAAMPEAIRPAPPWKHQGWGRGIYSAGTANLVLGVFFGRKFGEGYGYSFNYTVLAQNRWEFTLSPQFMLDWLLSYLPDRVCRVLFPVAGEGGVLDLCGLLEAIEDGIEARQELIDLAPGRIVPKLQLDLHLLPDTRQRISEGKFLLSELPELAEGLERRWRQRRGGQYFEGH